jgi:hypothetical protein
LELNVDELIASWWTNFRKQAPRIDALFQGKDDWDLPEWMLENLQAIHPDLMWEFGPARNGPGHRLVITPEARRYLRPLVREILSQAPQLPGWEFYEYRLPEDMEQAAATVEGRVEGDIGPLRVAAQPGNFHCVDLHISGFPRGTDDQQALSIAFVACEALLGEEVLDRWIGAIDVDSKAKPAGSFAIAELPERVTALIEQIRSELPAQPWYEVDFEEGEPWSVLEFESNADEDEDVEDFTNQDDLLVAVTVSPEMLQNAHTHMFDSARYSRCGERFCYLKIDGIDGLKGTPFEDRGDIEDAINAVLRPAKLGSTIGGGTGKRYSYVELALTDVAGAWQQMRLVLQEGHLPTRTWLLFHDDELSQQWHGLYDDSPEPPLPEVEED